MDNTVMDVAQTEYQISETTCVADIGYTKDQALEASKKYFNGDEAAADVFVGKYALRQGDHYYELTPRDMHRRMAREFARIEAKYPNPMSEEEIFESFDHFGKIVPQGSPMYGIGNNFTIVSVSNCFVVPSPVDSYGGILYTDQQIAHIFKRRGGVGFDISNIRPKGLATNNAAITTDGIGVFMERYSNTTNEVAQNGRRGALMLTISVHHPEIETFIKIKSDKKKVTGANVSIRLTDAFLEAVEKNTTYTQQFPVDSDNPRVKKEVNAREVWKMIIKYAHKRAEPGLLNWDTVVRYTPSDIYKNEGFGSIATNPCLTGDTRVATHLGLIKIKDLAESGEKLKVSVDNRIDSKELGVSVKEATHAFKTSDNEDVFLVTTNEGYSFKATSYHNCPTTRGIVKLKDLNVGDRLLVQSGRGQFGTYGDKSAGSELAMDEGYEETVPEEIWSGTRECVASYLNTLFDYTSGRVVFNSQNKSFLCDIQVLLANFGIFSTIVKHDRFEMYSLSVKNGSAIRFEQEIGFAGNHTAEISPLDMEDSFEAEISSIELIGQEPVYCLNQPENHTFIANGLATGNCSEIILNAFGACRLICLNLIHFIKDAYLPTASFDFDEFAKYTQKAQRLMDDLVDIEIEKIDAILQKVHQDPEPLHIRQVEIDLWTSMKEDAIKGRRTGLGITALGDTFAALGMRYGSPESMDMTDRIYKCLAINAYKSSCIMAGERGTFPIYDYQKEVGHPFMERLLFEDKELYDLYRRNGKRNIAILTTAPTGSVSMLTQTTSGIEPAFLVEYDRFRKLSLDEINAGIKPDRVDELGIAWKKYTVYHPGYQKWMDATGKSAYEESPYYKATSNDIDWVSHVDVQAAAQKWVDHSISKTVNIPENASEELVERIYMDAWKKGCKGVTVYRDKCRDGVLTASDRTEVGNRPEAIVEHDAPKRPKSLSGKIHDVKFKGIRYYVIVGFLDSSKKPYEVFFSERSKINLPEGVFNEGICDCKIVKARRGTYNLVVGDSVIADIVGSSENALFGTISRLTSLSLRHGTGLKFVVDQLSKDGLINDFNKVLARVLKEYVPDGETVTGEICEKCGSTSIAYIEKCKTCLSCANSKCS